MRHGKLPPGDPHGAASSTPESPASEITTSRNRVLHLRSFNGTQVKTPLIAASLAALCASGSVCAQSSVTLYGIIDEGLTFSNNQLGNKAYQMQSGISQGSRWGMQGTEDLGGGLSAIFRLENTPTL